MSVQSLRGYERLGDPNDSDARAQHGAEDGYAYSEIGVQIGGMERQLHPGVQQPGARNFLARAGAMARDVLQRVAARRDMEGEPLRSYIGATASVYTAAAAGSAFGPAVGVAFFVASAVVTASGLSNDEAVDGTNFGFEMAGQVTGMIFGLSAAQSAAGMSVGMLAGQLVGRGAAYLMTRPARGVAEQH